MNSCHSKEAFYHVSSLLSTVIGTVCLSVRLSVTSWYNFNKRRPMNDVVSWNKSSQFFDKLCDASGSVVHGCNCEFSAISGYNSEMVEVRIKHEYEVICDCLNDVICTDLKWPNDPCPGFKVAVLWTTGTFQRWISQKPCILQTKLVQEANRKSMAGYRMLHVSMTFSDLTHISMSQYFLKRNMSKTVKQKAVGQLLLSIIVISNTIYQMTIYHWSWMTPNPSFKAKMNECIWYCQLQIIDLHNLHLQCNVLMTRSPSAIAESLVILNLLVFIGKFCSITR